MPNIMQKSVKMLDAPPHKLYIGGNFIPKLEGTVGSL